MRQFSSGDIIYLIEAVRWTLALSVIAFVGGGLVGILLVLARLSRFNPIQIVSIIFIQVMQGTPLLIQLFIWFFGLSLLGANLPAFLAAGISLTLYASAFFAEIWRGSIEAIPRTQWDGSISLGITRFEQLRYVIVPQAVKLATPPTVGFMVQIVKNTSITALIGFVELARAGQLVSNATFQPLPTFVTVALLYFVLCFPLSLVSRLLERRFHVGRATVWSA